MAMGDLSEVAELEKVCFRDPWSRASFEAELRAEPTSWCWIVRIGGQLAGYMIAWFIEDEAHLANLAVAPEFRRRGLGRRLVRAVLEEAARRGTRWIRLEVRESNAAARALYQALGFRPVGRRRSYYADNGEDALLLELDLTTRARVRE